MQPPSPAEISKPSPTLSVLILAGGHSRRMGQDKALLTMQDGQSLLLHTARVAQQIATEVAVVTPWPTRYRAHLPDAVRLIQEPVVNQWQDLSKEGSLSQLPSAPSKSTSSQVAPQLSRNKPSAGPLSGFAYGWQHIHADWCLLLACDLPHLDVSVLQQWWAWIGSSVNNLESEHFSSNPVASLAANDKGWEPLCGFYHRRCLPSLSRQLAEQQYAFQPWLQRLSIARYYCALPQMFFNCNTPSEWQAAIAE